MLTPTPTTPKFAGFTLVELLVVISIIAVLAGLLTPVITSARRKSQRLQCQNRLGNIGKAADLYADDDSRSLYPWPKRITGGSTGGQLSDDGDARAALGLLYRYGQLDDPEVYVCPASLDEIPQEIELQAERRQSFRLEDYQCSYTWTKMLVRSTASSKTPLSGDKRGGDFDNTNHKNGRNVCFKGGRVKWYDQQDLDGNSKDAAKFRKRLLGFASNN